MEMTLSCNFDQLVDTLFEVDHFDTFRLDMDPHDNPVIRITMNKKKYMVIENGSGSGWSLFQNDEHVTNGCYVEELLLILKGMFYATRY
ncbi:hypothetical protein IMZ31_19825 (plasmid) [Pontibacillus sp. ALD_SL1]|uniref:hypothetical protein n=1 Tax=Pontibacillus sp. ALD_SL1 TaxID=2777185 RepID=UPI001A9660E0|nr:hypothetical protein [Pontibacillus sp. ALD_SL1]QST02801.1 hypothetical protein IMZ31_19825 [Pontibacillus sp. ALD_SL1]